MIFKNLFVCAVKVDGRILRERDGAVVVPFGAEFSLLFKNIESRKASVRVSIDGKDVMNGMSLIIEPNSSTELERFIDGSMDHGNRFRFIKKTQEIVEHRGDRVDDGLIRVEFAFEQRRPVTITTEHIHHDHHHHDHWLWYPYRWYGTYTSGNVGGDVSYRSCSTSVGNTMTSNLGSAAIYNAMTDYNPDEGITVKGSESNQHFDRGYIGQLDPPEVIIIRLCGETVLGKLAETPVFVKDKFQCVTCGKKSDSSAKFCQGCGTALS